MVDGPPRALCRLPYVRGVDRLFHDRAALGTARAAFPPGRRSPDSARLARRSARRRCGHARDRAGRAGHAARRSAIAANSEPNRPRPQKLFEATWRPEWELAQIAPDDRGRPRRSAIRPGLGRLAGPSSAASRPGPTSGERPQRFAHAARACDARGSGLGLRQLLAPCAFELPVRDDGERPPVPARSTRPGSTPATRRTFGSGRAAPTGCRRRPAR